MCVSFIVASCAHDNYRALVIESDLPQLQVKAKIDRDYLRTVKIEDEQVVFNDGTTDRVVIRMSSKKECESLLTWWKSGNDEFKLHYIRGKNER